MNARLLSILPNEVSLVEHCAPVLPDLISYILAFDPFELEWLLRLLESELLVSDLRLPLKLLQLLLLTHLVQVGLLEVGLDRGESLVMLHSVVTVGLIHLSSGQSLMVVHFKNLIVLSTKMQRSKSYSIAVAQSLSESRQSPLKQTEVDRKISPQLVGTPRKAPQTIKQKVELSKY